MNDEPRRKDHMSRMEFKPYTRDDRKFLAARILVPFIVERGDLIEAVQEKLYFEPNCLPLVRGEVAELVRNRKSMTGEIGYEGDSDTDFAKAVKVIDHLFPELKAYEERMYERM